MGVFKLGKMTFGSLFKKPETVLYPLETKPQPAGLKGHIEIDVSTCILCGICEKNCPTDCITVDKASGTWNQNPFACIQCGYCVTVCPKKSLSMLPGYHIANTSKDLVTAVVPEKAKPSKKEAPAKEAAPAKEESAPQPTESVKAVSNGAVETDAQKPEPKIDSELESKLALMSDEAAAKVREALKANA